MPCTTSTLDYYFWNYSIFFKKVKNIYVFIYTYIHTYIVSLGDRYDDCGYFYRSGNRGYESAPKS